MKQQFCITLTPSRGGDKVTAGRKKHECVSAARERRERQKQPNKHTTTSEMVNFRRAAFKTNRAAAGSLFSAYLIQHISARCPAACEIIKNSSL
jgi:hypothetical protein